MSRLTIDARTLRDLLNPVMPLACKDMELPALNCVQIRTEGNGVIASATDRFRLGICRAELPADAEQEPFTALVRVVDLKRILALFKVTRFDNPTLTFELIANVLHVVSDGGFGGLVGASITITTHEGEFPNLDHIIREALTAEGECAREFGVNAAFLADFKHAIRNGEPLVVRPGANAAKPVAIGCGDHFVGAIMPRRLISGDGDHWRRQWIARLTPKSEPEPAATPAPRKTRAKKVPA